MYWLYQDSSLAAFQEYASQPLAAFLLQFLQHDLRFCIVYRNEVSGKTIYFDYTRMTQGYVNDFEVNSDTATSSVLVNGMQGYLFQEKNWERQRSSITWIDSDKNLQFTIHAYLPQSRILQMAESVSEIP